MTTIKIFEDNTEINLEKLIETRLIFFANAGGGKSWGFRKLLEEVNNQIMVIILDVEGEYKTLREKYDYLLIGGEGDIPINIKSATLLPKKLLELNISTIIDISELKSKDRIHYVKKFLEALMELPRKYWKPCLIGIEETHKLCGQQDKHDSGPAVIDLFTRGRKRGFCGVALTQRIAKLHKDVVAECNNVFSGRMWLPNDIKTAAQILGMSVQEAMSLLRNLDPGNFFCFGPAINKNIHKGKIGKVKTTHLKIGIDLKEEISAPTDKIKKLLTKLSDLPKEAESELKDLNDHKNKIMELKRQVRVLEHSKPKPVIDEQQIQRAFDQGLNKGKQESQRDIKQLEFDYKKVLNGINNTTNRYRKHIQQIVVNCSNLLQTEVPILKIKKADIPIVEKEIISAISETPKSKEVIKIPPTQTARPGFNYEEVDEETKLGKCAKKIYGFLLANPGREFTRTQLGLITGYSYKSGGFVSAISVLNIKSMILKNGVKLSLNSDNINDEIKPEGEYSLRLIKNKLGKCAGEILDVLIENPSIEYTREDLAMATITQYKYKSGGFVSAVSKLNILGLIKKENFLIRLNDEVLELPNE